MSKIWVLVFITIQALPVLAADSKSSRMEGITNLCKERDSFFAFNLNTKRVWMGEGVFIHGARALEIDNVVVSSTKTGFRFDGYLQITWGNKIYRNQVLGNANVRSRSGISQITLAPLNGGAAQIKRFVCR